ncbi:enterochelin esterase [Paracoccus sp. (in: a-proteobacteria)]|uniref:enterochelin esterase n=1 Tax=Paracoccus sp. TaxID=267 RepID=UPI002AFF2941|nr:enterochelin esterase [Paracoccus sp. (in: a-proteobacteria)]
MVRLALLLAVLAGPGLAQDTLVPGPVETVELVAGAPLCLRIEAPPGSYLAGRIEAGALPVDADLLDAQGHHLRRLSHDGRGNIGFHAVAEQDTTLLQLSAPQAGRVGVALDQPVPPADQHPPAPEYLSPRIAALAAGGDIDAFWRKVAAEGTPMVEDAGKGKVVVTFLWRGASRNVRLFGAPSNDHEWLERLLGTDIWFKSFRVPDSLRLSYKLAPDVPDIPGDARARRVAILATAQMDPLNRHPWPSETPDRFNQDSTVVLRNAPAQPGTPPAAEADPELKRFTFDSGLLGNSREITLSFLRGLDPADPDIVLALIFDGEQAMNRIDAPRMLDTLTRQGALPPVVAVLIPSIDSQTRGKELPGNPVFAQALAEELLPRVAAETGIRPDPARTVLAGASYGGLAAATVALARPDTFGNAISMSGSFWWAPEGTVADGIPHVAAAYAGREKLPIRFFLSAGLFETGRAGTAGILETSRQLRDVLRLQGYEVAWREYVGGHDYLVWRGALADGLIALFGAEE